MTDRYILIDVDNTLFEGYYAFKAIQNESEAGILDPAVVNEVFQTIAHHKAGKISYLELLQKTQELYAKAHNGDPINKILEVNLKFAGREAKNIRPFFRELFAAVKNSKIILVTSEPQTIASPLGSILGTCVISSSLIGAFTGSQFILNGEVHTIIKPEEKIQAVQKAGISLDSVIAAFGDSISDVGILELAKYAYVLNPNPELRKIALRKGWNILSGNARLTASDHRRLV